VRKTILGDPGAVSRGGEKSERARKKFRRRKLNSFVTFPRPFRPFPAHTNCSWISEDGVKLDVADDRFPVKWEMGGYFAYF